MSIKSDSRLAEFLRRVLAAGDDAAPAEVIFGPGATAGPQQTAAQQFASSVHDLGYIEPSGSPDGDLARVRVTAQGREWLDGHDRNTPTLHPRFSS